MQSLFGLRQGKRNYGDYRDQREGFQQQAGNYGASSPLLITSSNPEAKQSQTDNCGKHILPDIAKHPVLQWAAKSGETGDNES